MNTLDNRILMATNEFVVVNKRIGEICETGSAEHSLIDTCKPLVEDHLGKSLSYLQAVHRIDRPVSGCVILACTPQAAALLTAQFNEGRIRKRYDAIVEINNREQFPSKGVLEHYLIFDRKKQKSYLCEKNPHKDGYKHARLSWETAGLTDRYACLYVYPETGRTHQIRAQLAAGGMPIKGDLKYGARRSEKGGGIRLHARTIQFSDPLTGDRITVCAPVEKPDALWMAFPVDPV